MPLSSFRAGELPVGSSIREVLRFLPIFDAAPPGSASDNTLLALQLSRQAILLAWGPHMIRSIQSHTLMVRGDAVNAAHDDHGPKKLRENTVFVVGDVFQVRDTSPNQQWRGTLVFTQKVNSWGIQAYLVHPTRSGLRQREYARFKWKEITYVGKSPDPEIATEITLDER